MVNKNFFQDIEINNPLQKNSCSFNLRTNSKFSIIWLKGSFLEMCLPIIKVYVRIAVFKRIKNNCQRKKI